MAEEYINASEHLHASVIWICGRMKPFWDRLSPWLDLPMNRQHWKLLCGFTLASAPMGFGLGHFARHYHQSDPAAVSARTAASSATTAEEVSSVAATTAAREGSMTSTVATFVVPAGVGWMVSLVLFPPRS